MGKEPSDRKGLAFRPPPAWFSIINCFLPLLLRTLKLFFVSEESTAISIEFIKLVNYQGNTGLLFTILILYFTYPYVILIGYIFTKDKFKQDKEKESNKISNLIFKQDVKGYDALAETVLEHVESFFKVILLSDIITFSFSFPSELYFVAFAFIHLLSSYLIYKNYDDLKRIFNG